jgi:hypothetical protein
VDHAAQPYDRRNERLRSDHAQLYLDLVRLVRREHDRQVRDVLMTIDGLDREPQSFWQSERDRDPRAWDDREIRVLTYASDRTRNPYYEWDLALLRLAGIIQPERVTGVARPADLPSVVEVALRAVATAGARLVEQIRAELESSRRPGIRPWALMRRH